MAKQPDYPVLIPYSELHELLDATRQIKEYKNEVQRLQQQVLALRITQQQCLERLRDLEKQI